MLKILIATGGTGGHLFPAQQLLQQLTDCDVLFAGYQLEKSPFLAREKVCFKEIESAPMDRWFSFLKGLWRGTLQALRLIRTFQPDVVVGFGSFHSFPVLLASAICRKKIVLFEPNYSIGKVNRFFTIYAKKVAFQFPVPHQKAVLVPLLPWTFKETRRWTQAEAREAFGLEQNRLTILVFGGSQGAFFINQAFCKAALLLKKKGISFQVLHLTGNNDGGAKDAYERQKIKAIVKPFEEEMPKAYAAADFAVCRSGASTTAELIRFQLPALLIPYPYAHDHQRHNGAFLKEGARMVLQKEASPERIAAEIELLRSELFLRKAALAEMKFEQAIDFGNLVRSIGEEK